MCSSPASLTAARRGIRRECGRTLTRTRTWGNHPKLAELPLPEWDGFNTQREDATTGPVPLIWFRGDPADANAVQFAASLWMLGAPRTFAWRGWVEGTASDPWKQEYNDFHSLEPPGLHTLPARTTRFGASRRSTLRV
jgi:hypothetical protein